MYDQSEVGVLYIMPQPDRWGFIRDSVALSGVNGSENGDIDGRLCDDTENALGHIPNPDQLDDFRGDFRWKHRTLVKVRNLEAGKQDGVERADYLMYVCLDENSGRQRNGFLEGLVSGSVKVYGSAFVFKKTTESGEWGDQNPAVYLNDRDKSNEFNMGMKVPEFIERILTKLMEAAVRQSSANQSVESPPH